MVEVHLNKQQSQEFASAIVADIAAYVESHQDEYEEFLRSQRTDGGSENQNSIVHDTSTKAKGDIK